LLIRNWKEENFSIGSALLYLSSFMRDYSIGSPVNNRKVMTSTNRLQIG